VRRVDDILDDEIAVGVKVSYSALNVHVVSLPMRTWHWVLARFHIVMRGCEIMN
jgi:uncharacterized membrane protein